MQYRSRIGLALAAISLLGVVACGGDDDESTGGSGDGGGSGESVELSIVGFAVPEAANKAIADEWATTPEGENVTFQTSYGASGDQSRAVVDGLEADYVHFSVASDVTRLVDEGLVAQDWDQGDNRGVVSSSIVVFGVRKGNPLGIEDWDDLVADDVEIVTANPASSGAARWNALAAWGQVIEAGGSEDDANAYVEQFIGNVVTLTASGRDTTTAFLGGTGDVAMLYENEAILAKQNGEDDFDYIIPETTILIENPGAVLIDADPKAQEWLDYVLSEDGQRQFALKGFRPIIDGVEVDEVEGANDPGDPFPEVTNLLTVDEDFESWDALSTKFFDEEDGLVTKAIADSGKA
jgi:sulfate/thiosulfate transport system substrate-binding protein